MEHQGYICSLITALNPFTYLNENNRIAWNLSKLSNDKALQLFDEKISYFRWGLITPAPDPTLVEKQFEQIHWKMLSGVKISDE